MRRAPRTSCLRAPRGERTPSLRTRPPGARATPWRRCRGPHSGSALLSRPHGPGERVVQPLLRQLVQGTEVHPVDVTQAVARPIRPLAGWEVPGPARAGEEEVLPVA